MNEAQYYPHRPKMAANHSRILETPNTFISIPFVLCRSVRFYLLTKLLVDNDGACLGIVNEDIIPLIFFIGERHD